ncbi:hypothetical protein [Hyphococcus lacteus]|uniref:CcmD family protein n=1 Tax=Hyphococcus lacteus TaxID=3143536 RepID=A0ABV3Z5X3_9PROT
MSNDQKSENTTREFLCGVIVSFVFIFLISGFAYCERQANQRAHAAKEYSGQVPSTDTNNLYSNYLLQAQQDVALWNYAMFIVALGALGVTVVGIYFIARTLDATLAAVTQAKKATRAANDAVAVTREIGEAQSRA